MTKPKKIILIVIDTLRADHMGCYGYKRNTSPNIDTFAKESILFNGSFSPSSHTIPSHGSIFTSKYPSNHTIGFNQNAFVETGKLNTDIDITLAEILSSSNYKTAAFVSGIVLRKATNFDAGFEVYDDEIGSDPYGRRDGLKTNQRVFKWLEENHPHDFFLFIHYFDVHGPYANSAHYKDMFVNDDFYGYPESLQDAFDLEPTFNSIPYYQILNSVTDENKNLLDYEKDVRYYKAQYDGGIRYVDDNIEKFIEKLKELNIYEDALIIITSDHGESLGENNVFFYHGLSVTLDQIAVPLLIKPHKGWNAKRGIISTPVSTIDLMPTILALCDYDYSDIGIEGRSLKKILEGKEDPILKERTLISENERQYALIYPNRLMELRKKDAPTSTYYPHIPDLIDSLNGKKCYWDSGNEYVLALPFDQYQRYKIIADIINKFRTDKKAFKILEVGASFEGNLKMFLPCDDIYLLDKEYPPEYKQRSNHIIGDITKLDIDKTYDIVVSIDTYEHIHPIAREKFINKLLHISKIVTIVAAPFDTPGVAEHEVLANELYRVSHGIEYKWLHEHIQNGLPSLPFTLELIKKSGFDYAVIPNGYLPRWFDMISIYLLTEGMPEFSKVMAALYEFYNKNLYHYDNLDPAYRQVIVINKKDIKPDFSDILTKDFNLEDFKIKYKILGSIMRETKEMCRYKQLQIKDAQIAQLQEHATQLQEEINRMLQLKSVILHRKFESMLRKIRLRR